jgi:hypothetical protein
MEFSAVSATRAGHPIASSKIIPSIAPQKNFVR